MGLGEHLLGEHRHDPNNGGHILRPGMYEALAAVGFLGRRRRTYQLPGLIESAGFRVLETGDTWPLLRCTRAVPAG